MRATVRRRNLTEGGVKSITLHSTATTPGNPSEADAPPVAGSKAASRLALSCNGELFFVFRIRVEQSLRSSKGDREVCDHLIVLPIL